MSRCGYFLCIFCTVLSCIKNKGGVSASKIGLSPKVAFPTDHSKTVLLLQFFFIFASVVSYVAFVLS